MRRLAVVVVTVALLAPAGAAVAQPAVAPVAPAVVQSDMRPIVIGLGAIAGVMVFNVLALGVEALPGGMAYAAGSTVPAEMSVAMSRVYATTSAVIGGWIGYYSSTR
jgi:hypothetical protein